MSMTGPILAGLKGTKITGSISYTLVTILLCYPRMIMQNIYTSIVLKIKIHDVCQFWNHMETSVQYAIMDIANHANQYFLNLIMLWLSYIYNKKICY
jgi:hypothetical protein